MPKMSQSNSHTAATSAAALPVLRHFPRFSFVLFPLFRQPLSLHLNIAPSTSRQGLQTLFLKMKAKRQLWEMCAKLQRFSLGVAVKSAVDELSRTWNIPLAAADNSSAKSLLRGKYFGPTAAKVCLFFSFTPTFFLSCRKNLDHQGGILYGLGFFDWLGFGFGWFGFFPSCGIHSLTLPF